jgi:hypothetical protein
MNTTDFAWIFVFFILTAISATSLGYQLISNLQKFFPSDKGRADNIFAIVGESLLIGMGIFGYLFLLAGLAGLFTKRVLLLIILTSFILSIKSIYSIFKYNKLYVNITRKILLKNFLVIGSLLLSVSITISLYLTAMQPPYTTDEMAYHFPEAIQIVNAHKINLAFDGHAFYGNIPKLMEVIYAYAISISGYQFAHTLNLLIFVGFLLVIFGFVKKYYGNRAAIYSVLLILLFDDFTWNATTGYIDAATTAFEISSIFYLFRWFKEKSILNLSISAFFIGISLSMKYSPLPTAFFIFVYLAIYLFTQKKRKFIEKYKPLLVYLSIAGVTAGFWYFKNVILHKNPFYPLYFGHEGYPEDQYKSLIGAIQQFGPKTLRNFICLTKNFWTPLQFPIFFSIYLSPIILFIKKNNPFRYSLFVYFSTYTFYWFFFGTHQTRFLSSALIISSIIMAIVASKINEKIIISLGIIIGILTVLFSKTIMHIPYQETFYNFWIDKFRLSEIQYGIGMISEEKFMHGKFGCQYSVIKYLQNNNLSGSVISNWSVWSSPAIYFYSNKNIFRQFWFDDSKILKDVSKILESENIKYIYINKNDKDFFSKNTEDIFIQYRDSRLPSENYLLRKSKLIFENKECSLYQINL